MSSYDAHIIEAIATAEVGEINFCNSVVGVRELELILSALKARPDGTLTIKNAGGVMSMMELGAALVSTAKEQTEDKLGEVNGI